MWQILDLIGMVLGFVYIFLEIHERPIMWLIGMVMPGVYGVLLWRKGIFGDAIMEVYYFFAGLYGFLYWLRGRRPGGVKSVKAGKTLVIRGISGRLLVLICIVSGALWMLFYVVLRFLMHSTVPLLDALTTALSVVALWLLSRKYVAQWAWWLVVDAVSTYLYVVKGLPFRAVLYGYFTVLSIYGWRIWHVKARQSEIKKRE